MLEHRQYQDKLCHERCTTALFLRQRTAMNKCSLTLAMLLVGILVDRTEAQNGIPPNAGALMACMPRVEDYTQMWWAEGFPGRVPDAPWQRCIQTGYYAMVLDTEALHVPHFGAVPAGASYGACGRDQVAAWSKLPSADLTLRITVDGKTYDCRKGGPWTQFTGPRLIESGRFMQRADVTDLVFQSADGERLSAEARFETAAWPDRVGLVLAARPDWQPFPAGDACFGRVGGGYGLDGTNHFEIPHGAEFDTEQFTLELWAFVPTDYRASERTWPWLACQNSNEAANGNVGIMVVNGRAQARMNIGGGRANQVVVDSNPLKLDAWNHLAMSYDGDTLRLFLNGAPTGERKIGRKRTPGRLPLVFGRRQDNSGDGYHFRGAVDEIRVYDRALDAAEVRRQYAKPASASMAVREWTFRADGQASLTRLTKPWSDASLEVRLATEKGMLQRRKVFSAGAAREWHEVFLAFDPVEFAAAERKSPVTVEAGACPVEFDAARGWHRVNLDGIEPILPPGDRPRKNDAIERIPFTLSNPTEREQVARLMFEKTAGGFRHRFGVAITGVSAILRDAAGQPTGIPVQLSKNWHNRPEAGVYRGQWFHGITQVRLPPASSVKLELSIVYGHWGGVAAASHSQLCLIGWGTNQLWDQSALGAWGESICYEPDQIQAGCSITDVRPLMVDSMNTGQPWSWTCNVGGGDFFRLFDTAEKRVPHVAMRTTYHRQGPCLTEVTYSGRVGENIDQSTTVSLGRSDDIVRGIYRLRMDVTAATEFSRLVIFQIGADTYSYTGERRMALGDETGLVEEWATKWGGDTYRTQPVRCAGRVPWASLHESVPRLEEDQRGAWANRGIVIRSWKARLGGKAASPWLAEHGVSARGVDSSTMDILPPPTVTRLEPGDFIEATIEQIVMPQFAKDYYGPSDALRGELSKNENTWRMIHREAIGNERCVEMNVGTPGHLHPDIRIQTEDDQGELTLTGGLGYVPITFSGLTSNAGYALHIDGKPVDQSTHGNDFWQTDFDPVSRRWSRTYNLPITGDKTHYIHFAPEP